MAYRYKDKMEEWNQEKCKINNKSKKRNGETNEEQEQQCKKLMQKGGEGRIITHPTSRKRTEQEIEEGLALDLTQWRRIITSLTSRKGEDGL